MITSKLAVPRPRAFARLLSTSREAFSNIVYKRRTAYAFSAQEVQDDHLRFLLEMTQRAPSSFNAQPYRVLFVQGSPERQALSECMTGPANVHRVKNAPVTAIFLADLEVTKETEKLLELNRQHGKPQQALSRLAAMVAYFSGEGVLATRLKQVAGHLLSPTRPMPSVSLADTWAFKNTMLAADHYLLAATALGLATAPMEGFDALRIRHALKIPERFAIPVVVATGHHESQENAAPKRSPRYAPEEVAYQDEFGRTPAFLKKIAD